MNNRLDVLSGKGFYLLASFNPLIFSFYQVILFGKRI